MPASKPIRSRSRPFSPTGRNISTGRAASAPIISWKTSPSEGPWANIVFLTYFNAGLRAVDVSDVLRPKEIGCYVPELPEGQDAIQSNDIGTDEHGRIYLIDRAGAGMHILEYTG